MLSVEYIIRDVAVRTFIRFISFIDIAEFLTLLTIIFIKRRKEKGKTTAQESN
jgi:hypothetical protein